MTNFLINFAQFINNYQNLQITEMMQPNYLGGLYLPSIPGLLSPTSSGRKNKITELNDKRFTLCHESVEGQKHLCPHMVKMLRGGERTRLLPGFAISEFR